MKQKGKGIHGHGQQCGDCWGQGHIRGLNGNGKNNTIKETDGQHGAIRPCMLCWWECKLAQPLWRTIQRFQSKLNIVISNVPTILLLDMATEICI